MQSVERVSRLPGVDERVETPPQPGKRRDFVTWKHLHESWNEGIRNAERVCRYAKRQNAAVSVESVHHSETIRPWRFVTYLAASGDNPRPEVRHPLR